MDLLQQARAEIDAVDAEMAALFERRMQAVADVVRYKAQTGKPVFDAVREADIIARNTARLQNEELRPYYKAFLQEAMAVSRAYQRATLGRDTAAYQGVEGAWSHIALRRMFPFARATAFATWPEVFDTVQNGDAALSKTALGDAAQLRVIVNQNGNWRAAAIWYTADQGSEITLSDSDFLYSGSEDGYLEPDDAFLENVALNYYKAFLNAVNDHDLSEMRFSTARNTDEQSSHVFSDLNAGNTYDTSTASCTLDGSSITWGTDSLTVNVSYMCVREDRDTAVREINSNHRTICMVWQDGMWQVDDIAFLSDDDFAAHKYADLNK